jgi:ribonuclease-3
MTLEELQKHIGIQFSSPDLLKRAFIHRSHLNEAKNTHVSNERLEFLGDAVLSFCTSHYLYEHYPDFEGTLTKSGQAWSKPKSSLCCTRIASGRSINAQSR